MSLEILGYSALIVLYFTSLVALIAGGITLIVKSRRKARKIILGAILLLAALMLLPLLRLMLLLAYLTIDGGKYEW